MVLMYNKTMKILSGLFLVFAVSNLFINRVFGETVSLQSLVTAAKQNNPEIIAARKKLDAVKSRIWQEKTWENPQLFIDWQKIPKNDFDLNNAEEKMYGISQTVPFPGKLSIKGKIARYEAEKSEWEYRETELKILADLKIAYAMYFYVNKSIETYKQTAEIMNNFSKVAESKYVVGTARQGDVLRAQVETSKMQNMVITMEQEKETVKAELNSLIGKNADEIIGAPEELAPEFTKKSWNEIKKLAIENNPEIRQQNASVSKNKWSKKMSYTEFLPDFDLTYRKREMEMGNDSRDFMLGFTVPLWFWKPALGVKEMSDELKMAESEKKNMELMAVYQAKEFFVKLKTAERFIELYQTSVLPPAEQSLKVTESAYRLEKEDFLNLLDSVRTLLDFQLEYYKYISQYYQNLAMLEKIAGVELATEE